MHFVNRFHLLALIGAFAALIPLNSAAEDASDNFAFIYGKHDAEWRACHSNDDCALIVTPSACALKLPVTRDKFDEATAYAGSHESCQSPVPDPRGTDYSTACKARECVLVKKVEKP